MSYIAQTSPSDTISSIGDENTYITLSMRRLGARIELVTALTTYYALSGRYEYEELDRQFADDEDEATEIATDLEYAAQDKLKILDIDFWKEPMGFPEALEQRFSTTYAIAAE